MVYVEYFYICVAMRRVCENSMLSMLVFSMSCILLPFVIDRVLGGLLSAHLLVTDTSETFGDLSLPDYDNELLSLAHDLASRLLPAFSKTTTGIPYPRVTTGHEICVLDI